MIVMPSNNSSGIVHHLATKYPDTIGWLLSPGAFKEPRAWLPYAIDNGKFPCWTDGREWSEDAFLDLLDRCKLSKHKPRWVAVPDSVGNREETLSLWQHWNFRLRRMYGWPLAFVVQDGMTFKDIPESADVVFVGGTTRWKWRNVSEFCARFPRVHVGRVNYVYHLERCEQLGAESCDGTGFFRGGPDSKQAKQLIDFVSGHRRHLEQKQLWSEKKGGALEVCGCVSL